MRDRVVIAIVLAAAMLAPLSPARAAGQPAGSTRQAASSVHTAYLVGRSLHLPSGRVIVLGLRKQMVGDTALLGHTPAGWILGVGDRFISYRNGTITQIGTRLPWAQQGQILSRDRNHIVQWYSNDTDGVWAEQIAFDGTVTEYTTPRGENPGDVTDTDGDRAYLAGYYGIDELVLGSPEQHAERITTDKHAVLVDVDQDAAFVGNRRGLELGRVGPVSLAALRAGEQPTPRWKADWRPTRVSADGRRVLGTAAASSAAPFGDRVIQVRRMSDGRLLLSVPDLNGYAVHVFGWDGDGSAILRVVAPRGRKGKHFLQRCVVATGHCTRVTKPTNQAITLPTSVSGVQNRAEIKVRR